MLRAAAGRINTRPYVVRDGQSPTMTEMHASAIEHHDLSVQDYFVEQALRENPYLKREQAESMVQSRARSILQQSNSVAMTTLHSLASVVRGFGPLPGRKVLFFVSDGFLMDDNSSTPARPHADASRTRRRARGVVIYSLDAQGLRTGQPDASEAGSFDPGGPPRARQQRRGRRDAGAALHARRRYGRPRARQHERARARRLGRAQGDIALLPSGLEAGVGDGRRLLPKYQRIEVSVRERPELRVLVRRGFYNGAAPTEAPRAEKKKKGDKKTDAARAGREPSAAERELMSALHSPLPRAALPTSVAVGYVHGETEGSVLTVSIEIDRGALTFLPGEQKRADFDLIGAVIDDRGKPVKQFGHHLSVTSSPLAPESQQHVVYSFRLPLAAGLYQVRAATRDANSGRTGSAMQWVEVPEAKRQFSMSSIFLGERTTGTAVSTVEARGDAARRAPER